MSDDTEVKELISLTVEKARETERIRILNIIELLSYRYDSPIVNRFIADLISIIVEAKE